MKGSVHHAAPLEVNLQFVGDQEGLEWAKANGMPAPRQEPNAFGFFYESAFRVPPDSGRKTALARLLMSQFATHPTPSMLWIYGHGVWPSSENPSLFEAVRAALGELRPLTVTPCHLFSELDQQETEWLLDLCLYFVWDVAIIDPQRGLIVRVTHDEVLEVLARESNDVVAVDRELGLFGLESVEA